MLLADDEMLAKLRETHIEMNEPVPMRLVDNRDGTPRVVATGNGNAIGHATAGHIMIVGSVYATETGWATDVEVDTRVGTIRGPLRQSPIAVTTGEMRVTVDVTATLRSSPQSG